MKRIPRRPTFAALLTLALLLPFPAAVGQAAPSERANGSDRAERAADAADSPAGLQAAKTLGAVILERQRQDGRFVDPPGVSPWQAPGQAQAQDRALFEDWQLLVHAGACRALFQLYQATGEERFREAGERGLWHLAGFLKAPPGGSLEVPTPARQVGDRPDLTAETLLAALEWIRAVPPPDPQALEAALATPRALGQSLLTILERLKGQSRSPMAGPVPLPRAPGLATLALARLSVLDPACGAEGACRWREGARSGAGWMMAERDLGKTFDALPKEAPSLQALDALHALDPQEGNSYFLHGRRMGEGILRDLLLRPPRNLPPGQARNQARNLGLRAERAVALMAAWRISRRSGAEDAERFREGARRALPELLEPHSHPLTSPDGISLQELRWAVPALLAVTLDRNGAPW